MKKIYLTTSLCLFFSFFVQAQSFEGTFVMHVQDDNTVNFMQFAMKNDRLLIQPVDESLAKPVKILMQKNSPDVFVLSEEQGMKLAIKSSFQLPEKNSVELQEKVTFNETGKTKKISGYNCKEVVVDDGKGQQLQVWLTPELGFSMASFSEYMGMFTAVLNNGDYHEVTKYNDLELYQKNMALEISEVKEKDAVVIRIKDIVKKSLAEEDFSIEGYIVIDIKDLEKLQGQH